MSALTKLLAQAKDLNIPRQKLMSITTSRIKVIVLKRYGHPKKYSQNRKVMYFSMNLATS